MCRQRPIEPGSNDNGQRAALEIAEMTRPAERRWDNRHEGATCEMARPEGLEPPTPRFVVWGRLVTQTDTISHRRRKNGLRSRNPLHVSGLQLTLTDSG